MNEKQLFNKAIQLLARSALTEKELHQKLVRFAQNSMKIKLQNEIVVETDKPTPSKETLTNINTVIVQCVTHRWLNDKEYTERFIESKLRNGYGKNRILFELKKKGIILNNTETYFFEDEQAIISKIAKLVEKRFHLTTTNNIDNRIKQKIWNYLQYRGFSTDEIISFINHV